MFFYKIIAYKVVGGIFYLFRAAYKLEEKEARDTEVTPRRTKTELPHFYDSFIAKSRIFIYI